MKQETTNFARELRKNATHTEQFLWRYLCRRQLEGIKFRRQQPIGSYIVDFVNFEKKLIIELDGGQHAVNKFKDTERDNWLKGQGFKVLRFWDNEVFNNVSEVLEVIRQKLSPSP